MIRRTNPSSSSPRELPEDNGVPGRFIGLVRYVECTDDDTPRQSLLIDGEWVKQTREFKGDLVRYDVLDNGRWGNRNPALRDVREWLNENIRHYSAETFVGGYHFVGFYDEESATLFKTVWG